MLPANIENIQFEESSSKKDQFYQANQQVEEALIQTTFLELTPFEKLLKEGEKLLGHITDSYVNIRLDEAFRKIPILEGLSKNLEGEEKERFQLFLKDHEIILQNIKDDHEYMEKVLKELELNEGWNMEKNGDLKVWYKKEEGSNCVSLRMEAELDLPLINMITLINEVELWPLWIPFVRQTQEVKAIHKGAKMYYLEASLPFPLAARHMHVYGVGVNRLYENGAVLIMAQTKDHDNEFFKRHDAKKVEKPKDVNVEITLAGFEVKPIGPNKIKFQGVANINPNFTWLPDSILNFIVRKFSGLVFSWMVKHAKNFKGSAWEKETLKPEKRGFYDWLNKEVDEYFEREAEQKNKLEESKAQ